MIGTETAAIDRWIEPAIEPERLCQRCHHEESLHDRMGCWFETQDDKSWNCACEEML